MKICISFIDSEIKDLFLDVQENDLIDTIPSLLNSEINNNCDYDYVYNKAICEFGKTLKECNFEENCKIYAIKKSEKPLKRHLTSDPLNSILNFGLPAKKLCLISSENHVNQTTWKNESLSEIQSQMTKIINEDPSLMKSLLIQPQIEDLINNPSSISAMFAANPVINETIINHPDKVKFFTDASQYSWVKNIMQEPKKYDNIMENYAEYLQHAVDSKRYRKMRELFEKTVDKTTTSPPPPAASPGEDDVEIVEGGNLDLYESSVLQPIIKSPYTKHMIDIISTNKDVAESVLKSCPYGSNLSEAGLESIQNVMPAVTNQWRLAMEHANSNNSCEEVLNYLRNHPLELDEYEIGVLEAATSKAGTRNSPVTVGNEQPNSAVLMMQEIMNHMKGDHLSKHEASYDHESDEKLEKNIEILNEMGFTDNIANVEAITGEHGNLDRAVYRLIV